MIRLAITSCGPGTSLQDHGRFGWQRYGLGPAGSMDRLAHAEANLLVANPLAAAVIEMASVGMRFIVEGGACRIAIAGGEQKLSVDGITIAPLSSVTVTSGQNIDIGPIRSGRFAYLAVAGGFDAPQQLGSVAFHSRARIGGFAGRFIQAGDTLPLRSSTAAGADLMAPAAVPRGDGPIRVMAGPQDDFISPAGWSTFLESDYRVTQNADRMGIRLAGPAIAHNARGYNIVSDGIVTGSIQVPGSGEPLILLADRQTTGGYPKIATVITADLPRLAQAAPGDVLRFATVSQADAIAALRAQTSAIDAFQASLRPLGAASFSTDALMSARLIDGWISAADWQD